MSVEELLSQPVISVSRRPERLGQAASHVFVIDGERSRVTGSSRLPDLLRLAPQLFVAQSSSTQWAVNARGFVRANATSNKLLVLVDGRTVYSPLFSNVFWDAQDLFLPDLDRIEVISGPAGANWGSNAVNGVINILTRSAHSTLGPVVTAGVGTDERHFGARFGTRFGESGAVRVYAQGREFANTLDGEGRDDDFDEAWIAQTGFRADWGRVGLGEFTVQGDLYRTRTERGGAVPDMGEGGNLLVRWNGELTPGSVLSLRAYHDYSLRQITDEYRSHTHTSDFEFQHQIAVASNQILLWGGNYRWIRDAVTETKDFVILPPRLDFDLIGLFAQHELKSSNEAWHVTTGLRLENNHFSDWETQPNLRIAWRPVTWTTVWGAASRATRTPGRLEAGFFAPEEPPYFIAGAPELTAETLVAYEAGIRHQFRPALSVTAVAYHHDYDRLRSVEVAGMPIVQANGVAGRARGLEAFLDWDVTSWWRLRAGGLYHDVHTWVEAGHTDGDFARGERSFPEFQFSFRNTLYLSRGVTLWLALRHVDEVPVYDGSDAGVVPAYTELDAAVSWRVGPDLELTLRGRNLLDRAHPEIGFEDSRREIERSVQLLAKWHF